jgi:hypothetical protein
MAANTHPFEFGDITVLLVALLVARVSVPRLSSSFGA